MTIVEIRNILEAPYNRKVWKSFIQTQFTNNNLLANDAPLNLGKSDLYTDCYSLGNYAIDDYTKIGIFEIQLADKVNLTRNRVALRNLIKSITLQVAGAMVVFVQGDKWRFSYISKRKVRNRETNSVEDKETAPKRYTYLFGNGEKALTAAIRFDKLIQKQKGNLYQFLTLNDFEEAFSVEKLSKEFFQKYKEAYEDFVEFLTGKRYNRQGAKYVELVVHPPNFQLRNYFNNDEKQARDFCKRMMGRIVFLYFIQKKGWMAVAKDKKWGEGNPDFLYDLFNNSKNKDDFYSQELVPLFFKTLNNLSSESTKNEFRFPYLNGGLFDDSQDNRFHKLVLPQEIFANIFETFNNFNFTIYEDAPDEHTVAVDPEMLGHIFENLLEDNKEKGAFYTPKEIVHYMCRESLKDYLIATDELNIIDSEVAKNTINSIIQQQELTKDEIKFAEKNAYKIIDALEQVKVCDPAIGSGAFPMGLLQEIFNAQIYLQELKGFKKGITDAQIKKHIIEESIYGVDIDAGAVDIARLRFWLSLVVDELEPQPLPNLSFKIVCANTLIPLGKIKGELDYNGTQEIAMDLESVRHDYFNASKEDKSALEQKFTKLQKKLLVTAKEWVSKEDAEIYERLLEFSPFEDKSCTWFDAWWMFGVKDGFDIVIGNPPYVQLQKDGGKLAKLYQPLKYDTFERTGDIYSLFYEKGVQLLKPKGILCYITSNKWMRANYGASTRQFFVEKTYPLLLIDFGSVQVFETATVDTNILFLQNKPKAKKHETKQTFAVRFTKDFDLANQSINDFINENGYHLTALNQNTWVVGERDIYNIKEFVEKQGVELKNWKIAFYLGLKTGFNEAFIIDIETRNKLIKEDKNNEKIIKPLLRGKDISAWYPEIESKWLINTHNGVKSKGIEAINVKKDYPSIYKWLLQFEEQLQNRQDKGDEWTNLRNCAYLDEFLKPKIIYRDITQNFDFSYLSEEVYSNNTTYLITGEYLKYLTCFLNSNLFNYCFRDNFTDLGSSGRRLFTAFFEKIPVKKITHTEEKPFALILDYLVALKKENSQEPSDQFMSIYFEQIANALVYELYFKEAFAKESLEVANYVAELPVIDKKSNEPVILQIRKAYIKAHEQGSPIRNAVEGVTNIPQINLINNSVTI
jgi:adenine-specific DNA-methyltransferase